MFHKATRSQARLRMALIGPAGSGKTYSALAVASHLGKKIAVLDTERGSASKYAGIFSFDVAELENFNPQNYITAIKQADAAGYDVLVIDSLSHAWMGTGGALELVDHAAARSRSGNSFAAWREVTPVHNALVNAILQARCHVVVTMRTKTEYVLEKDERTGKTNNNFIVSKTRCPALSGQVFNKPGENLAVVLKEWLSEGVAAPVQQPTQTAPATPPAAPAPTLPPAPAPTGAATVDKETVRMACKAHSKQHGLNNTVQVLERIGQASRLDDVKPEKYSGVLHAPQKEIA